MPEDIQQKIIVSVESDTSGLDQANDSVATLRDGLKGALQNAEQMRQTFGEGSKEYANATQSVKKLRDEALGLTGTFKEQKRELERNIQAMTNLFGANSKEVIALKRELSDVKANMEDFNDEIKALDPGNKFVGMVHIGQALVGTVQAATGAMTLFGVESDKANEVIAKLQALQALSQVLDQVDGLKRGYTNLANALGLTKTAADGAKVSAFGLGTALKAIGIGLITAAVAYLVDNWKELSKSMSALLPGIEKAGALFNNLKQVVLGVGNAVVNFVIAPIKALIRVIQGDMKGAIEEVKKGADVVNNYKKGVEQEAGKQLKDAVNERLKTRIEETEGNIRILEKEGKDTEALHKQNFARKKALYEKDSEDYRKTVQEELEFDASVRKKKADDARKASDEAAQKSKAATEKAAADRKALTEELKRNEEAVKNHLKNLDKLERDAADEKALLGKTERERELIKNEQSLRDKLESIAKEKAETIKSIEDKAAAEIKLNPKGRASIEEKKRQEILAINQRYDALDLNATEEKNQKDFAVNKKYNDALKKFIEDETMNSYDRRKRDISAQYDKLIEDAKGKQDVIDQLVASRDQKLGNVDRDKAAFVAETTLKKTEITSQVDDSDTPEIRRQKVANLAQAQLEAEDAAFQAKIAAASGNKEELERLEAEHEARVNAINKQASDERRKIDDDEFKTRMGNMKAVGDLAGALGGIFQKQTVAAKALNTANALMNTYVGISEIWRAKSVLPEPFGTIQKVASTVVAATSGFKAVKAILATNVPGGGGGGGISAPEPPSPPSVNGTNTNLQGPQDVRVVNQPQQTVKAYVVDRDLENSQQKNNFLNSLSSF